MESMVEFKVQVEEEIVKQYGRDLFEQYLREYLSEAILKLLAKEILDDLKTIDLDESSVKNARERAWNNYGKQYFVNVIANA